MTTKRTPTKATTGAAIAQTDQRYVWHPFTQMRDWLRREPIVIVEGQGAVLRDSRGREYLDANSSIWTNLHGHRHPKLDAALTAQSRRLAHCSALGLANEPASVLAMRLAKATRSARKSPRTHDRPDIVANTTPGSLRKVFFSDDGSTALEVALKLAYEVTRRRRGTRSQPRFLSLQGGYHGDTVGAVSLGHIDLFHKAYAGLLFKSDAVMAPYCYRCPFNRAQPERTDARKYRRCNWECVGQVDGQLKRQRKKRGESYAGFVFEPLMQGAAGMIAQPSGWLRQVTDLAREHGALLIADEVMTGFGRTGVTCHIDDKSIEKARRHPEQVPIFATARVGVTPDFLCLAKGLTGGYLPMAATLTTQAVFDEFLGEYEEFKSFFHGHSYTGNPLGAAVSLASLDVLQSRASVMSRWRLQKNLANGLKALWRWPNVGDVRQVGLVAGVELVRNWRTREPFALGEQVGIRVSAAMARRGVLTRPIGNVLVLMPPYCTTAKQMSLMVEAMSDAIEETLGGSDS